MSSCRATDIRFLIVDLLCSYPSLQLQSHCDRTETEHSFWSPPSFQPWPHPKHHWRSPPCYVCSLTLRRLRCCLRQPPPSLHTTRTTRTTLCVMLLSDGDQNERMAHDTFCDYELGCAVLSSPGGPGPGHRKPRETLSLAASFDPMLSSYNVCSPSPARMRPTTAHTSDGGTPEADCHAVEPFSVLGSPGRPG